MSASAHPSRAATTGDAVRICDVTLRDGMQVLNRSARVPLAMRADLFGHLHRAGLPYLEVGSFVSPRFVPAMADTAELLALLPPKIDAEIAVLVPNLRYYEKLLELDDPPIDTVALFVSASEDYSKKNTTMSVRRAMAAATEVADAAGGDGRKRRAYLSCAFRELDGEEMPADQVEALTSELLDMGCYEVALSDTDGKATPSDVERIVGTIRQRRGLEGIAVHLHDRYGLGLTNAYVAYGLGVRTFDATVGGIGGTSAIEGSVGNLATEELAYLFRGMDVEPGLDLGALASAQRLVAEMSHLVGEPSPPSKVMNETLQQDRAAAKA